MTSAFAPFAVLYVQQAPKPDYPWAAVCIMGAVCFIFRT
jgi:uncharacterized protein (DUF486 family)